MLCLFWGEYVQHFGVRTLDNTKSWHIYKHWSLSKDCQILRYVGSFAVRELYVTSSSLSVFLVFKKLKNGIGTILMIAVLQLQVRKSLNASLNYRSFELCRIQITGTSNREAYKFLSCTWLFGILADRSEEAGVKCCHLLHHSFHYFKSAGRSVLKGVFNISKDRQLLLPCVGSFAVWQAKTLSIRMFWSSITYNLRCWLRWQHLKNGRLFRLDAVTPSTAWATWKVVPPSTSVSRIGFGLP